MKKAVRVSMMLAAGALVLAACAGGEAPPSSFPGLTLDGNNAYLASNLHVYKFDAANGQSAWQFPITQDNNNPRGPFAGKPLLFGNVVIVGGTIGTAGKADPHLYGLNPDNGQEVWRWQSPNITSTHREFVDGVVTDGKLVFAASGDYKLYALDVSNDKPELKWVFSATNKLWARPAIENGKIFLPSLDHNLYILDAATGKKLGQFTASASIASTPAVKDGIAYFGSFDQHVYAVDSTGKMLWQSDPLSGWIWCDALLYENRLYVGDAKGGMTALDAANGKILWRATTGGSNRAQPVVNGNKLYVVSFDNYVYSTDLNPQVDANGNVTLARVVDNGLGRRLLSTPAIHNGALLVPLFDGDIKLTAINLENNQKLYEYPLKPQATPAP
jgi:outer membrane protein assembly factor BamB